MELRTSRLLLRDFLISDASDLQEILGDEETMEFMEPPYTPAQTTAFLEEFCIARHGAAAAVLEGKVIGYLLFHPLEPDVYELGWIFHRAYWRKGYAWEACWALMRYGFEEKNAHKLMAETIDGVKSVGLMKKLGMRPEGIQRRHTRDNRGNWADLYLYGILREEFFDENSSGR